MITNTNETQSNVVEKVLNLLKDTIETADSIREVKVAVQMLRRLTPDNPAIRLGVQMLISMSMHANPNAARFEAEEKAKMEARKASATAPSPETLSPSPIVGSPEPSAQ